MQERTNRLFRIWAVLVGIGAAIGLVYMPFVADAITFAEALRFAVQGVLIASLVFGFEILIIQGPASERIRRAPFAAVFLGKTLITTILIVAAYGIGGLVLFPARFAGEAPFSDLIRDTAFALCAAAALQFILMVRTIVGGRILGNIILGRYHRPFSEERIFMFLDVTGSTALAEHLGGVGAYSMISRFFFDVAQETMRYGGETHEYIGDEVVVTWPLKGKRDNTRCLQCYFAICDRIDSKSQTYRQNFGQVPRFRTGLHGGPIIAGECGDDKIEIVYFGDTINTAARIQEACKEFQRPLLLSGDLLQQMEFGSEYSATSLGRVRLRGREQEIELFAVERPATDRPAG